MWIPRDADAGAAPPDEVLFDPVDVDGGGRAADCVEYRDELLDEPPVTVRVEPVECRARGASSVEARSADDDDLIGRVEDAPRGRFEDTGPGVEADKVVVPLEECDHPVELALADRLRDPRIVIRRDDLEPTTCLGRVAADVRVPLDPRGVREKRCEVRGGLAPDPMTERSRVGVAVDGD